MFQFQTFYVHIIAKQTKFLQSCLHSMIAISTRDVLGVSLYSFTVLMFYLFNTGLYVGISWSNFFIPVDQPYNLNIHSLFNSFWWYRSYVLIYYILLYIIIYDYIWLYIIIYYYILYFNLFWFLSKTCTLIQESSLFRHAKPTV